MLRQAPTASSALELAEFVASNAIIRIQFDRPPVMGRGLASPSARCERTRQHNMHISTAGLDCQSRLEMLDCQIDFILLDEQRPQIDVSRGLPWIDVDRALEFHSGRGQVALQPQHAGQPTMCVDAPFVDLQSTAKLVLRILKLRVIISARPRLIRTTTELGSIPRARRNKGMASVTLPCFARAKAKPLNALKSRPTSIARR